MDAKKTTSTILLASLIVAVLSLGVVGSYTAEAAKTPYTLAEVDRAFTNSEGYVTYDSAGNMVVDKKQMREDGVARQDIKIMNQWAKLNNKIISVMNTEDQARIDAVMERAKSGKFSLLTNATTTAPTEGAAGQTDVNFFSLTACGITYGETSHKNPAYELNKNGYTSLQSIRNALIADGNHRIVLPWTDSDLQGRDYGKQNTVGQGGCDEGEFRDQNVIYYGTQHIVGTTRSSGWYTLQQINEPNPEIFTYTQPTFWWAVYTANWHYDPAN